MTTEIRSEFGQRQSLRTITMTTSIVSLIFGALMLIWPVKSAMIVAILVAVYAIIGGLLHLAHGVLSQGTGRWTRVGFVALGLVFIAAGVLAFGSLGTTTLLLAVIVTTFIGAAWIIDGIVALFSLRLKDPVLPRGDKAHKGWTIFYAVVGVVAGVAVVASPLFAALWLWLLFGASLIVLGIGGIIRAASIGD
ncbi:hypothetical protein GCM10010915_00650 [Microbacterium faecale]|uniref:DUF308 domain-containing protein n=1 Tax=Microbacterium faecale TaxID=1804630 RepID=A0A917DBR7_9MICO|nr:DUF308 domain-containing protein [Microbacterium faecale]GGD24578.1 hypothetical protein GCM10010915_00650 [Microbacterium faecale]